MSAMSDFTESGLIGHFFRSVSFAAPTGLYVGLVGNFNSGNLESGTLTDEISGGGYARISYGPGTGQWSTPSNGDGHTQNIQEVTFSKATNEWGNVSGMFISDSLTGGNTLFYTSLTTPKSVSTNDTLTFPTGDIDVTFK